MRAEEFHVLTEELEKLMPRQRGLLTERLQKIGHVRAKHAGAHNLLDCFALFIQARSGSGLFYCAAFR
jgi:hypothetical protein